MTHSIQELIAILREARNLLALPGNNFFWSSWEDTNAALTDMDGFIAEIESGRMPERMKLEILFAPTGSIQEVSVSSGWGDVFLNLAARFDAAIEAAYICK